MRFDNKFSLTSAVSLVPNVVNPLSAASVGRLYKIRATNQPFPHMRLLELHRIFNAFYVSQLF